MTAASSVKRTSGMRTVTDSATGGALVALTKVLLVTWQGQSQAGVGFRNTERTGKREGNASQEFCSKVSPTFSSQSHPRHIINAQHTQKL